MIIENEVGYDQQHFFGQIFKIYSINIEKERFRFLLYANGALFKVMRQLTYINTLRIVMEISFFTFLLIILRTDSCLILFALLISQ